MKYFLLNKQDVKQNIWTNPILVKTKCMTKIKKLKSLQKKIDILYKTIKKDLYDNNAGLNDDKINLFLSQEHTEITNKEYNSLSVLSLLDTAEQRIKICNKTNVLKGKLYGDQIKG